MMSEYIFVNYGVSHGTAFGLLSFILHINDIDGVVLVE